MSEISLFNKLSRKIQHITLSSISLFFKTKDQITPKVKLISKIDTKVKRADAIRNNGHHEPKLVAYITKSRKTILAAQRLRYEIFVKEYGANISCKLNLDRDQFDKFCDHLVVKDTTTGQIVAYTRLLSPSHIKKSGRYYSASEFDLSMLKSLDGRIVEVGRTCVHADYRTGVAINTLWMAIASYATNKNISYMIGCASVSLVDNGELLSRIMPYIREKHMLEDEQVTPLKRYILDEKEYAPEFKKMMPPLLKAYLRLGAKIGGEPAWDPEFNCVDMFILMDINAIPKRYAERFFQAA